jgi:hypothetical protein
MANIGYLKVDQFFKFRKYLAKQSKNQLCSKAYLEYLCFMLCAFLFFIDFKCLCKLRKKTFAKKMAINLSFLLHINFTFLKIIRFESKLTIKFPNSISVTIKREDLIHPFVSEISSEN